MIGAFCGNPISAANRRKYRTCWTQRPKARYSASNLTEAILVNVILINANLKDADLNGANLRECIGNEGLVNVYR